MYEGIWLLAIVLAATGGILIGRYTERQRYLRRIRSLQQLLEQVMRGDYTGDFSPFREGEFSQLAGQLELTVRRTSSLVDRLAQEKDDTHKWIADISHQLKTPLTGLTAYLDLLEQTENDACRRDLLQKCVYLADRMEALLRSLLELARMDAGAVELHLHPLSLDSLLHDAVRAARAARPDSRVGIAVRSAPALSLRGDRKWLTQALLNLLVNALDHTEGDTPVEVSVSRSDSLLMVKITNHGRRPDAEDVARLFERFYRGRDAAREGFGIGLSLAESVVRRHKGHIRAAAEPDGLSVIIALPCLPCADRV